MDISELRVGDRVLLTDDIVANRYDCQKLQTIKCIRIFRDQDTGNLVYYFTFKEDIGEIRVKHNDRDVFEKVITEEGVQMDKEERTQMEKSKLMTELETLGKGVKEGIQTGIASEAVDVIISTFHKHMDKHLPVVWKKNKLIKQGEKLILPGALYLFLTFSGLKGQYLDYAKKGCLLGHQGKFHDVTKEISQKILPLLTEIGKTLKEKGLALEE